MINRTAGNVLTSQDHLSAAAVPAQADAGAFVSGAFVS